MSKESKRCLLLLERCKNLKQLKQSHAQIITCGLQTNTFALSRFLAFCSNPFHGGNNNSSSGYALKVFERIANPTTCIFNTMLKTLFHDQQFFKTIDIYRLLFINGMYPDNYTLPYVLKASAGLRNLHLGKQLHCHCLELGLVFDMFAANTLIGMYTSLADMGDAQKVFDEMPSHDAVSWTIMITGYAKGGDVELARLVFDKVSKMDRGIWGSMISGYVQNNCFKEGLLLFRQMQSTGIVPDEAIFVSVLSACAHLGALDIGIWIQIYMNKMNLQTSVRLSNALIHMYAKCGRMDLAQEVFDEMPDRDTICWNAMISGWAMQGDGRRAIGLFSDMESSGITPDDITFLAMFTACSYSGMAYEGLEVLNRMRRVYNIEPKSEHYGCIVDFLGREGMLKEANKIIEMMPGSRNPSEEAIALRALLSACCNHGDRNLAEVAAERIMSIERDSGAYVLLSNLYSSADEHENAGRIRKMMKKKRIDKSPGCSSIEINGIVHEFIAGEKIHPCIDHVNHVLLGINKHLFSKAV
ncbi:pentatricopeptide repeat-containing protein At2g20540-like [Impatiens glandulifera]|uniref:pentatricopeptide repeat-containing protein At2g20540-like n=1 Tax=Impatiens glandulifera TaxID=253017 RepID=UPI001FB11AD6|nr:pentatricopeptide repeat-containing protein At2g20540-like [Impatiens glandulifera]